MTNTAQEIREAFTPITVQLDTSRLTIIDDRPRASDAHRMIDALGDRYGKELSVLEWCYIAIPECLDHISDAAYQEDATPEQIRDNAYEWADQLTTIYHHEQATWASEHRAVFDAELDDWADSVGDWPASSFEGSGSIYKVYAVMQCQAYANAFYVIADQWPEPEEEETDDEEPEHDYTSPADHDMREYHAMIREELA